MSEAGGSAAGWVGEAKGVLHVSAHMVECRVGEGEDVLLREVPAVATASGSTNNAIPRMLCDAPVSADTSIEAAGTSIVLSRCTHDEFCEGQSQVVAAAVGGRRRRALYSIACGGVQVRSAV